MMDLRDGLIAHHRVYWGWVGFNALPATVARTRMTAAALDRVATRRVSPPA